MPDGLVQGLAEVAVGLAATVASTVAWTASAVPGLANDALNATTRGEWPKEVPEGWRRALARGPWRLLRPPPKPVLLALCVSALRYGLVRTALVAASAKLTLDLLGDGLRRLRGWRAGGRRRAREGLKEEAG